MTTYELKSITILGVRGVDFRYILWGISRNECLRRLKISLIGDKRVL